jgi:hypothetical protein
MFLIVAKIATFVRVKGEKQLLGVSTQHPKMEPFSLRPQTWTGIGLMRNETMGGSATYASGIEAHGPSVDL